MRSEKTVYSVPGACCSCDVVLIGERRALGKRSTLLPVSDIAWSQDANEEHVEPKSAAWTPDPMHCRCVQFLRGGVDGDVDWFSAESDHPFGDLTFPLVVIFGSSVGILASLTALCA